MPAFYNQYLQDEFERLKKEVDYSMFANYTKKELFQKFQEHVLFTQPSCVAQLFGTIPNKSMNTEVLAVLYAATLQGKIKFLNRE